MCNDARDYLVHAQDPAFATDHALRQSLDDVAIQRFASMLNDRARARRDKFRMGACMAKGARADAVLRELAACHEEGGSLVVPIHTGNHWYAVHINFEHFTIRQLDSADSGRVGRLAAQLLSTLRVLDARWRDVEIILEDVPQQGRRSNDCGVFVCLFSLCIATDPAAPITLPTDLGSFSRQARLLVAGVAARDGPGLEAFNRMY